MRADLPADAPASASAQSSLFALQAGAVIVAALYFAREVLIPVTIAILLSFVLAPIVHLLRQLRLGRIPSILLTVFVALALLTATGWMVGAQLAQVAAKLPEYTTTVERKVSTVRAYTVDRFSDLVQRLGRMTSHDEPRGAAPKPERGASPGEKKTESAETAAPAPASLLEKYLPSVLSPLASAGIVLFVAIFVLAQKEDLRDRLIRLFGARDLHRTTVALDDAATRLSRFFLAQFALNASFGVVIGAGLAFIGVPNPLLWAILAGIFRFVPYIGALISAALPIALAAAVDPGWTMVAWTIALFAVVEVLVSQVIEPILYGHSAGLSPFAVIVSAIFWTWIWGPIGLVLSTPMTLCLVVLGRHVERVEFFEVLLGDTPALTPVESFYQRLLASDVDEVQDHAEVLLKERSLSSYYDDVALEGMKLAAQDLDRGVLTKPQMAHIRDAIQELVRELASYEDVVPETASAGAGEAGRQAGGDAGEDKVDDIKEAMPRHLSPDALAWHNRQTVLCLAGKGPLDEAASLMLCQLLEKHGMKARVASFEAASRTAIANLPLDDVAMICVSYLHISGNPPHLRYLVKRLRERLKAPILVGLWPANDRLTEEQKRSIGAEWYTTSLRQAVDACVSEATNERPDETPAVAASAA